MSDNEYDARIARWANRLTASTLTPAQADGNACVACGHDFLAKDSTVYSVPVGCGPRGTCFVCEPCDEEFVRELTAAEEVSAEVASVARLDETVAAVTALDAPPAVDVARGVARISALLIEIEFDEQHPDWVMALSAAVRELGIEGAVIDHLHAEATLLASYAPGVEPASAAKGERLMRLVGGVR